MDILELERIEQFKDLGRKELQRLAEVVAKEFYAKGEIIFQQQQPADFFYLLKQGVVKLEKIMPHEPPHVSSTLEAGAYLGNFSFLPEAKHSSTAQALADCELLVFNHAVFNRLTKQHPGCGLKILKGIIVYLCQLLRKMDEGYLNVVDYMIDGEFYGTRHQTPAAGEASELKQTGTKRLTPVTGEELYEIPLFVELSSRERESVAQAIAGCSYQEGENIFDEHTSGGKLFIVYQGVVKISKRVQQDKVITISILRGGRFFGVLSLFEDDMHSATAQAIRDSRVLSMEKQAFEELIQKEPRCGLKIMNHICQEVYDLMRKIEQDFHYTSKYVWETGPFYV